VSDDFIKVGDVGLILDLTELVIFLGRFEFGFQGRDFASVGQDGVSLPAAMAWAVSSAIVSG
jgi:hypothetical protein